MALSKQIAILAAIVMVAASALARSRDTEPLEIGAKAPGFELPGTDGKTYTLDSFRQARVLTIIFTANHCPTAQAYEARIKQLSADYPPEQMQLVAISSNHPGAVCPEEMGYSDLGDSFGEMKIRASEREFNFPYLYDGDDQKTALAYGPTATPHVFVFDRERRLRYRGRIDDMEDPYRTPESQDARNAIDALLAGKPVPVETTKAFGCSMKWISKVEWRKRLDEQWKEKPVEVSLIGEEEVKALGKNPGDKLRLVNVWATWCGPCIIEFPELVKLQRMYGQRGFEVVTVSADDPSMKDRVLSFLEDREAALTNYLFESDDQYGLIELIDPQWQGDLPYTMLVAPGGEVIYRHDGIIDPLEVRKVIIGRLGRYYADDRK
jgi:thiol-disulfide isomerase/thioredoxin